MKEKLKNLKDKIHTLITIILFCLLTISYIKIDEDTGIRVIRIDAPFFKTSFIQEITNVSK